MTAADRASTARALWAATFSDATAAARDTMSPATIGEEIRMDMELSLTSIGCWI